MSQRSAKLIGTPAMADEPQTSESENLTDTGPDEATSWMRTQQAWSVGSRLSRTAVALYDLDDVRAAAGQFGLFPGFGISGDGEHQAQLQALIDLGRQGCWRWALGPPVEVDEALTTLMAKAPHFADLGETLRTNAKAARAIGLPMFCHPILLVGQPGIGKTYFLSKIAEILKLPFRLYAMSSATLSDGLQGGHPSWHNAAPGLVAKTLLREIVINPVIFVDEFDKVYYGNWSNDPYRAYYQLLDPSGSRKFTDEFLGFAMNASRVLWIMAANNISDIPAPILDRLTILRVPEPEHEQRLAVIQSIYDEANASCLDFFEPNLSPMTCERLLSLNARSIRIAIESAMTRAAADQRRALLPDDIREPQRKTQWRVGFY